MQHDLPITTAASASSCCGGGSTSPAAPGGEEVTTCPVMPGSTVVKSVAEAAGLFRDHQGARYWFCCAGCGPLFDADPQKYAVAA